MLVARDDLRMPDAVFLPGRTLCVIVEQQRLEAVESIIKRIKHLDPDIRSGLVAEIEKRATDLPNDLMMTDSQIQLLSSSEIAIGAHTVNHPILASVSDEVAQREILDSKLSLEGLLQKEVSVFAYPNGKPGQD